MDRASRYRALYEAEDDLTYRSAGVVADLVLELHRPMSVVDLGCGTGAWLQAFSERGVQDFLGLDGEYALDRLRIPRDRFQIHDLTEGVQVGRTFDLAVSVEVGEHLPQSAAETFVASLTELAPVVLFSAAIPGQGGFDHANEQWPGYWSSRFAERGFRAYDRLRERIWDDDRVAWWYRQNLVLYASLDHPMPGLTPTEPRALVHPVLWGQAYADSQSPRALARKVPWALRQTARRRAAELLGRR